MIEQLFGSKTRVKLLQLFYSNPNRSFYVREITRKIDEQINSVRRELANLLSIGIISSDTNNNRLYYEVNQKYDYYEQLGDIFGKGVKSSRKKATATKPEDEDSELKALGNVELAVLTGQFTRDETSGIDFLLVGDINPTQLAHYVADLESKEGKEIRYAVMKSDEFAYRRQVNDRFLSMVLSSKKQVLADKQGLLESAKK
ncbi:MAG: putative transcriptional regulator [Candidatus Saccharibacteria bacterium]|nr:putative transcriptional regulator [Candidatus Saccharibacteria bacterium]